MARKKRTSAIIQRAETRAASLEAIDKSLALGKNLTLTGFKAIVKEGRDKLNAYNTQLSEADATLNQLEALEDAIADQSERMLKGVASQFGRNSDEYEMAGGTRKAEIRRKPRTPAAMKAA